jgi:hypothetical protein
MALLGLAVFGAAGHLALGLALVAITVLNRTVFCKAWLYPLRDFMGFCFSSEVTLAPASCAIEVAPTKYFP